MESFISFRRHLAAGGIVLQQHSHPFNLKNVIVLITLGVNIILLGKNFEKSKSFEEYADIFYRILFSLCFEIIFLTFVINSTELFKFIDNLEATIEHRCQLNYELQALYTDTSQRISNWIEALHFVLLIAAPPSIVFPIFASSIRAYFTTELDNAALQLPVPLWFPFDTDKLIGYIVAVCLLYLFTFIAMSALKCFFMTGIATIPMLFALADDIRRDLNSIQRSLQDKPKRSELAKPLAQLIQFHSDTKQLAGDLSKLLKITLMMLVAYVIVGICCTLLLVKMKMEKGIQANLIEIATDAGELFVLFLSVFGICEFGEHVGAKFEKITIAINELKWYLLPRETCKMLTIIIVAAQELTVELEIFGSISSNRITFKEVCNKAYSSFMLLQRIDN